MKTSVLNLSVKVIALSAVLVAVVESSAQESTQKPEELLPQTPVTVAELKLKTDVPTSSAKVAPKRFTGSFVMNSYAMVSDVKSNGSKAMLDSENQLGLTYVANDNLKLAVNHNFGLRSVSDSSQLNDFGSDNGPKSGYKTLDPTIHANFKMAPLMGSKPFAVMTRYYVPISQKSQSNQSPGILRAQVFMTWNINPRFDLSLFSQARLYMNSTGNTDESLGSDSVLRGIVGPSLAYNISDKFSTYYMPYLDMRSVGFQRGQWNADKANNLNNEIGIYYTMNDGNLILNPAWVTSSSKLGSSAYQGTGSDDRTEYDFNLIAYF